MARIHVMPGAGPNTYRVLVHAATPAGNNAAGKAWSACIAAAGRNRTELVSGTNGPGETDAIEHAALLAGTVLEAGFDFTIDPAWSNAQRNQALDDEATKLIAETLAELQTQLRYFGATRN